MGTTTGVTDDDGDTSGDDTEAEAESTAAGSSGGGTAADTDHELENACEDESECVLHSDCCTCEAVHIDEAPASCNMGCERNACERWGVTELLCSHTCHIFLLECDPAMVTCATPAPQCEDGFVPSVDERCWSGYCVPEELCRP